MKFTGMVALICALAVCAYASDGSASDNLDEQIALLEKENATLKKSIRLEALKKENASLQGQLTIAPPNLPRQQAVRTPDPQAARSNVSNALAYARTPYATKARSLEAEVYYPVPEQFAPRWAGAYIGGHAGMGFGTWPTSLGSSASCSGSCSISGATNNSTSLDATGAIAGGHAGYLWQVGQFVFGPELDVSASTIGRKKTEQLSLYNGGPSQGPVNSEASLRWLSTLRGRAGIAAGDWLFFGTGGLAVAGLDLQTNVGYPNIASSEVLVGYVAGGGLEYAIGPHFSVRAEYLYYGLSDKALKQSYQNISQNITSSSGSAMAVRPSTNVVRAGVDWRFN